MTYDRVGGDCDEEDGGGAEAVKGFGEGIVKVVLHGACTWNSS